LGNRKLILSVDRLDYTKGIPQRIEAFDLFLEENPEYKEKVTLVMVAVPSRTGVEAYMLLKKEVDELVGRINGKHGTIGWLPVWYLYRSLSFNLLAALYCVADVALVTPLRDGMNLIAKEFKLMIIIEVISDCYYWIMTERSFLLPKNLKKQNLTKIF